jgi:hypothetical protein
VCGLRVVDEGRGWICLGVNGTGYLAVAGMSADWVRGMRANQRAEGPKLVSWLHMLRVDMTPKSRRRTHDC